MFVLTSVVILAPRGTKPQLLTPLWRQSNILLTAPRPQPCRRTKMLRIYRDDKIIAVSEWNTIISIPKNKQTTGSTCDVHLYVFFKYCAHVAQSSQHVYSVCMVWFDQCLLGTDVYLHGTITFKYKSVYILIRFFRLCSYIYVMSLSFEGARLWSAPRDDTMHHLPYKTAHLCVNLVTSDSIVYKMRPEILCSTPLPFLRNDSWKFAKP